MSIQSSKERLDKEGAAVVKLAGGPNVLTAHGMIQTLRRFDERALILVVFIACLIWASLTATVGWNNNLSEMHGFRQTQTAITSYYLVRGGSFLRYETPILGAPWSIPFEFPLYQWIVASVTRFLRLPLVTSGRLVGEMFFGLSLVAMWGILSEVGIKRFHRLVFLSLTLVSPQYVFWSRSFMIESTAVFFCVGYLYFVVRYFRTHKTIDACLGGLFGITGALVKVTTFPSFLLVGGLIYLYRLYHKSGKTDENIDLPKRSLFYVLTVVMFICLPILVAWVWVRHTDQIRSLNLVAFPLSSAALKTWNFGTLNQRLLGSTWKILLFRTVTDILGSPIILLLLCAGLIFARHRLLPVLICLCGFLSAFLIFTNLHVVHNYYAYANGLFLIGGVSWSIVGLLERKKWHSFLGSIIFLACLFSSINGYYGSLYNIQKNNANAHVNLAFAIKNATQTQDVIVIFQKEWSAELPFYSERRALIWPVWMEQNIDAPAMQEAIRRLGNQRIGAIVFCDGAQKNSRLLTQAANTFGINGLPNYEDARCAVYRSSKTDTANSSNVGNTGLAFTMPNYRSHHEAATCERVAGWIWDKNQPEGFVSVDIYDGDTLLASVPANQFRQDLLDAGEGDGKHAFDYTVPERLRDGQPHSIEVKVAGTELSLANSPKSVTCAPK
jgi:hypothetical protein